MTALELSVRRALEAGELRAIEIAAQLGVSREFVSRIRARMRREQRQEATSR